MILKLIAIDYYKNDAGINYDMINYFWLKGRRTGIEIKDALSKRHAI